MRSLLLRLVVVFTGLLLLHAKLAFSANNLNGFYTNFEAVKATDHNNQQFDFSQLQSRITLFNFIYTQCSSVCNTQTHALSKVFHQLPEAIKQNVSFVSISLDPLKDGPQVLKKYAKKYKADVPSWHFLSLNFFDIKQLSEDLILFQPDYGPTLYDALENTVNDQGSMTYDLKAHATHLWLIDTTGRVRQKYVGNPVDIARLTKELSALHRLEFNQQH